MGIYVGAEGVKTVNSLYVGAEGVKTVTAVYVGAGGTYKVWPDAYSLEDNGILSTTGRYATGYRTDDDHYDSNTDRQTAGTTQVYSGTNSNHWFYSVTPIDLSKWNYLCYAFYVGLSGVPSSTFYVSGMVGLSYQSKSDCLQGTSNSSAGAIEEWTSTSSSSLRYYIRSASNSLLTSYSEGYMFVKCDISACTQTDCYLSCCGMLGGGSGNGNRYRYLKLVDGYGPFLYENASDCTLTAPSGNTMSFTMTMTSTSNKYTIVSK